MKKIVLILAMVVISLSAVGQGTSISYVLEGRRVDSSSTSYFFDVGKQKGIVVVEISVDRSGRLKVVQVGAEGTTTKNEELLSEAKEAASRTFFSSNRYAPIEQPGAIIYAFGEEIPQNLRAQLADKYHDSSILKENVDQNAFKFLGIPIDGSLEYVTGQLIEKGFKEHYSDEYLEGQFNGEPVKVFIHTYHDKVDRIIVEFEESPEMSMREQYNHLLSQLENSEKYQPSQKNLPIPDDELFYFDKGHKASFSSSSNGEVCLTIIFHSSYCVALYYDNLNNRPHGEDL